MAYSDKIKLKEYKRLRIWLSVKKVVLYLLILGAGAFLLFSSRFLPAIASAVLTVLLAAGLFCAMGMRRFFAPDWEGEIVSNRSGIERKPIDLLAFRKEVLENHIGSMDSVYTQRMRCVITVRRDRDGKLVEFRYKERLDNGHDNGLYCFRTGDRVRHHRGLPMFEKEDTSKDKKLLCLKCLRFSDREKERCDNCGMTLLK